MSHQSLQNKDILVEQKPITNGINFITAREDGGISMAISGRFPYLYS
jgi:hypothetical protein